MPMNAAEIISYPGFQHVILDLPPTQKGVAVVAKDRGGPIKIAYELHGRGPRLLVWIMGLGAFKWYWQRQTRRFGHEESSRYTCLIFDNRGMGESDKPLGWYSTSEMGRDTVELLQHVGWTVNRQLHVIGISLGGMIAQELAFLQPDWIASLSLVSTAAELINTVGYFENLRSRINIFIPRSIDTQLVQIKSRISASWLSEPDPDGIYPTNGDRFAATELKKRSDTVGFTRLGFICQAIAAGYHKKSAEQLRRIAEGVGGKRIQLLHGSMDNLITLPHCELLWQGFGGEGSGVTKHIFPGRGHYLPSEEQDEFDRLIEAMVEKSKLL